MRHTETEEREDKGSSTRPLLLGPLGTRGRVSPHTIPPDEVAHWVTPLFHLQPDSQEDGHTDKDRQTDGLTHCNKKKIILYKNKGTQETNRQKEKRRKKTTRATTVE